ncbi:aldo/keto reductase [Agromyces silvae]|uniref:aldo/keto reductase n=1 Tax=Agromyces silvae TaxID=3388266 RepID=UPI00359F168D
MNLGRVLDERDSFRILDLAVDLGVTFIDTANSYGTADHKGLTEEIIGRWFDARPGVRDRVVLATKVFAPVSPGLPGDGGYSALAIRREADASLRRLRTDHIDLYQFHHIDRATSWPEVWQAVDVLVDRGKIVYTGSSNFAGWNIAEAQTVRERHGRLGLVSEQAFYNLVRREAEREVLPAAQRFGLGVIAWSPLQDGLLAGGPDGVRRLAGRAAERRPEVAAGLERFERFSAEAGHPPAELALAWLLHRPGVHGPVIGPRTPEQLESAVRALTLRLDDDQLDELDRIFPPAGEAPEYYAW